ncbi:methyl-accepting chemotaxis protein [Halovenus salina]|uniref:Methyl-accepting chemotaxis protein n=1 Tax=Halovenus salina TaxID=1510225 RepID=A0ABD5VYD9_9EURY
MSETVSKGSTESFDIQRVLDIINLPSFALDGDGTVIAWDDQIADLLGVSRANILGEQDLGYQLYEDESRKTLAERVLESPRDAHEQYDGVGLADEEYALLSVDAGNVYEDKSTLRGQNIWFIAAPVFEAGELIGVIEIVQDIDDSARHQQELEELFDAVIVTMQEFEKGNLGASVPFDTQDTVLGDDFLRIADGLEAMGTQIEQLIEEVEMDVAELDRAADDVADSAQQIDTLTTDQVDDVGQISSEVSNLSATVEEIASTAEQVEQTSTRAEQLATQGSQSASQAVNTMETVGESAHDVAGDVDTLEERMAEIDEVVEVINNIAEQTNMLALNASIEAARAGEAGEGFAVVADEVKSLAEESQQHANDIEEMVANIRSETAQTVSNLQETTERVDSGVDQVQDAMERFEDIVEAISETAEELPRSPTRPTTRPQAPRKSQAWSTKRSRKPTLSRNRLRRSLPAPKNRRRWCLISTTRSLN